MKSRRLPSALLTTSVALWTPSLIAAALDHRVRRSVGDIYFWPGLIPGRYLVEDHYGEHFVWITLASLGLWTCLTMKRRWMGWLGAAVQGALSTGFLMALVTM